MVKYWIIKTGSTYAGLKEWAADFEDWIIEAMGIERDEAIVWNLEAKGELPEGNDTRGIIVTGSLSNVAEDLPRQGTDPEQMLLSLNENGYGKHILKRFKEMYREYSL